jgi:P27 family predicted phage terminase small subunit
MKTKTPKRKPPPEPPAHLDAIAAAKWREITAAPDWHHTAGDNDLLEMYCGTWSRWKSADRQVAELGAVIKSPSGYPIQNPYLSIANRCAVDLLKIGRRLNLGK